MKYVACMAFALLFLSSVSAQSWYSSTDLNDSQMDMYYDQRGLVIVDKDVQLQNNQLTLDSQVELSNGQYATIKVMPIIATNMSQHYWGLESCGENNSCTVTLKEKGRGDDTTLIYEVEAKKPAKLFGFIESNITVHTQVNAETGQIDSTSQSWWHFMAST